MIAENRKRVRGDSSRGDMKNRREQFARELEHVRNHQQQALRRGERGADGAGLQHTVDGANRTAFALHFDDGRLRVPYVFFAFGRPLIAPLGDWR